MWCYRLVAPYTFERTVLPDPDPGDLRDGQVLLRFLAAGICGSDLPGFRGVQGRLPGDTGALAAEMAGFPVHEIVGEVVATAHPGHRAGDRVVGWASGFDGLMEYVTSDGAGLAPYDEALTPAHAVGLQPLACILYAVEQLPPLHDKHVAVIGQGSIGLLFSYVVKAFGAAHVTGVDPIYRDDIAAKFGVDTVVRTSSDRWITHLSPHDKPDIVIEAVGHQVATLNHAVSAAASGESLWPTRILLSVKLSRSSSTTSKSAATPRPPKPRASASSSSPTRRGVKTFVGASRSSRRSSREGGGGAVRVVLMRWASATAPAAACGGTRSSRVSFPAARRPAFSPRRSSTPSSTTTRSRRPARCCSSP